MQSVFMFVAPEDYLPNFDGRPCQLGIDEAGRGPVVGAMVYGCAYSPIDHASYVAGAGFADSKQLTEPRREVLWELISGDAKKETSDPNSLQMGYIVNMLSAESISGQMLRRSPHNLNAISHDAAIAMIRKVIAAGANLDEVYVDTVGDPLKYEQKLKALFPQVRLIVVCPKADSIYPIVSAASICAKVNRDRSVKRVSDIMSESLQVKERMDSTELGSGYPSDERTKQWLKEVMDNVFLFPKIVRFSWDTVNSLCDGKSVPFNFHDDDIMVKEGGSLTSMLARKSHQNAGGRTVSKLFTNRNITLLN